ncbi:MAG: CPBP family intramembrane metalloprotease [Pirellulales bacterium]|nr:CPBP family intramembrane metalloprotease [Pirellulales bacterium]
MQEDLFPPAENIAEEAREHPCWRCGSLVAKGILHCPECDARLLQEEADLHADKRHATSSASLKLLFISYGLLLATGVIHAAVLGARLEFEPGFNRNLRNQLFAQVGIVEVIDTIFVAIALWLGHRGLATTVPLGRSLRPWLWAIPALLICLVINFGYHALLRSWLHVPLIADELTSRLDLAALLLICVQPALVEEAFCRLFALDCLRGVLGVHGAVWISATMFGFMHVAVLPSVPYLISLGAVLAYFRVASGSILLPIALHFLHNLAVFAF